MNLPRFSPLKKTIFAILVLLLGSPSLIHARCGGVYRWSIKVASDADKNNIVLTVVPISIADWGKLNRPEKVGAARYTAPNAGEGSEATVYQIEGYMTEYIKQQDDDYHLILADGHGHSMVAEVVDPNCIKGANDDGGPSRFDAELKQAATDFGVIVADTDGSKLDPPVHVRITGVGFFDKRGHGRGQAPNTMEMHPILKIEKIP